MRAGLAAARFDGQVRLVLVDKLTVGTHTTGSAVTRRSRAHGATAPLRELVAGGGLASDDQQAGQRRGVVTLISAASVSTTAVVSSWT